MTWYIIILIVSCIASYYVGKKLIMKKMLDAWLNDKVPDGEGYIKNGYIKSNKEVMTKADPPPRPTPIKQRPANAHPLSLHLDDVQSGKDYIAIIGDQYVKVHTTYKENTKYGAQIHSTYTWIDKGGNPGNYVLGWSSHDWWLIPIESGVPYTESYDYRLDITPLEAFLKSDQDENIMVTRKDLKLFLTEINKKLETHSRLHNMAAESIGSLRQKV